MERIGFSMRLLPGSEAEYRRRHAAVWPDLLADLRSAGARNYSIFLRGDDLFAYLEVDDFAAFTTAMADSEAMRTIRSRLSHSPVTRLLTRTPSIEQSEKRCAKT